MLPDDHKYPVPLIRLRNTARRRRRNIEFEVTPPKSVRMRPPRPSRYASFTSLDRPRGPDDVETDTDGTAWRHRSDTRRMSHFMEEGSRHHHREHEQKRCGWLGGDEALCNSVLL